MQQFTFPPTITGFLLDVAKVAIGVFVGGIAGSAALQYTRTNTTPDPVFNRSESKIPNTIPFERLYFKSLCAAARDGERSSQPATRRCRPEDAAETEEGRQEDDQDGATNDGAAAGQQAIETTPEVDTDDRAATGTTSDDVAGGVRQDGDRQLPETTAAPSVREASEGTSINSITETGAAVSSEAHSNGEPEETGSIAATEQEEDASNAEAGDGSLGLSLRVSSDVDDAGVLAGMERDELGRRPVVVIQHKQGPVLKGDKAATHAKVMSNYMSGLGDACGWTRGPSYDDSAYQPTVEEMDTARNLPVWGFEEGCNKSVDIRGMTHTDAAPVLPSIDPTSSVEDQHRKQMQLMMPNMNTDVPAAAMMQSKSFNQQAFTFGNGGFSCGGPSASMADLKKQMLIDDARHEAERKEEEEQQLTSLQRQNGEWLERLPQPRAVAAF
jgi:hypothetical protein